MRTADPVQRESKRQAILDAACRCFAERGYDATRTADICALAGMSSGNMFHYFASKHEVLLAVVERDGAVTAASVLELAQSRDPMAALLELLDAVCALAGDPIQSGLALEISAQAHRDEDVALRFKANDRSLRDGLELLLRAADRAKQLRTVLSIEDAATWLAALIDSVFARVAADPDFRPQEQSAVLRRIVLRLLQEEGP